MGKPPSNGGPAFCFIQSKIPVVCCGWNWDGDKVPATTRPKEKSSGNKVKRKRKREKKKSKRSSYYYDSFCLLGEETERVQWKNKNKSRKQKKIKKTYIIAVVMKLWA
ncbi:hypothetical protein ACFX2H_031809 [Malus domestica]